QERCLSRATPRGNHQIASQTLIDRAVAIRRAWRAGQTFKALAQGLQNIVQKEFPELAEVESAHRRQNAITAVKTPSKINGRTLSVIAGKHFHLIAQCLERLQR